MKDGRVPARLSGMGTLVRVPIALLITALAYGFVFSYRTDYLGHYLGGFGGTLLLLSVVVLLPLTWKPWFIFVAVVVAIGIGFGTESTIFELAIFDPVDFYNQSLGAVVAGASISRDEDRISTGIVLAGLSIVAMVMGFYFAFL